jgi:hypothetical protein
MFHVKHFPNAPLRTVPENPAMLPQKPDDVAGKTRRCCGQSPMMLPMMMGNGADDEACMRSPRGAGLR